MAGLFDKVKKGFNKGTAIVSAKSTTLIETNKLKQEISAAGRSKKEAITELGTTVYTASQAGEFSIDMVQEVMARITEADILVAELEAKIQALQEAEKSKLDEIKAEAEAPGAPPATEAPSSEVPVAPVATPAVEEVVAPVENAVEAVVEAVEAVEEGAEDVENNVTGEYKG